MANIVSRFVTQRFLKPEVDKETARLKKELNRAKSKLEEKEFDLLTNLGGRFGINSRSDQRKMLDYYVSWAYANISVIAERVADIDIELYQYSASKAAENVVELESHPALDLLLRVNDFQTKWDLVFTWAHNMMTMGEAAWYLVGRSTPNSEPTEIWPLRPDYIEVIPGNLEHNQFVAKYVYKIPGKPPVEFNPWEIIFFKNPHPTNAYRGYGIMEAAMMDVQIDLFANDYNKNFFENQARPDGVLTTEHKLGEEVLARVKSGWQAMFGGPRNAGKTAVLEGGLTYQQIQQSAKDMDFLEQQRWTRDKMMALFKNTKVILGITEDVNRANAEASEYVWLKHNIRPKMQRLVDHLNEFFIPIYGDNLFLSFCDPLPESTELKIAEYTAGVDKWLTRNEIRAREGLDPVEGGDALYMPISQTVLGQEMAPENDPQAEDDSAEDTAGKHFVKMVVMKNQPTKLLKRFTREIKLLKNRIERNKRLSVQIHKVMKKALNSYTKSAHTHFKNGEVTKDVQKKRWQGFAQRTQIFEEKAARIISAVLMRQKRAVLKRLTSAKSFTKGVDDYLPDDGAFVKVSMDALRPIILAIAAEEGKDTFDFLGMVGFEASSELRMNLEKLILAGSESYIGTMKEAIKSQLIEGVSKGEGIDKLKKRVTQTYSEITPRKAQTIARTETIRAANATSQDAFKQSGVVGGKQWFTAPDCVDPECLAYDGEIIEIDADFANLDSGPAIYSDIGYPPLHPNCRCTISPVLISKSIPAHTKRVTPGYTKEDIDKIKAEMEIERQQTAEQIDQFIKEVKNG